MSTEPNNKSITKDQSPFVHLHIHTEFSLLDGAIRVNRMLKKSASLNMESAAITDHGNMFGAVEFYSQAVKAGIQPIIGCEAYIAPNSRKDKSPSPDGQPNAYHLVLLVMDETGYRNLSRLVTLGNLEGFYYHPRIDMELLRKHNAGLIALKTSEGSVIPAGYLQLLRFVLTTEKNRHYPENEGRGLYSLATAICAVSIARTTR